jgi:hypothetical protein
MNDDMTMESDSEARFGIGLDVTRPTESQLKLMTSKERRQLRNKLSARNFRVRRKGTTTISISRRYYFFFFTSKKSTTRH